MTATIYAMDPEVRPDAANDRIAAEREARRDECAKPRVGDYVRYPDGHMERISHDWGDLLQTSTGGSWYLSANGGASFSGSLNHGVPADRLNLTEERRPGRFWFFDRDWPRAHSAVYVTIDCRVYAVREEQGGRR